MINAIAELKCQRVSKSDVTLCKVWRFLNRAYRLIERHASSLRGTGASEVGASSATEKEKRLLRKQRVKTARIGTVFVSHFMRANDVAFRLRHCRATLQYHSLRKESRRGLAVLNQSKIAHYLAPETGVHQVQNGVRNAADVLVDRKPIVNFCRIVWRVRVVRIAIAIKIPRGINKGVHGVSFAARRTSTFRACGIHKLRRCRERRSALTRQIRIRRQHNRQIPVRYGNHAVFLAINDGNGRAPVSLARDAPILKSKDGFFFPESLGPGERGHFFFCDFSSQATEFARVYAYAVVGERLGGWLH